MKTSENDAAVAALIERRHLAQREAKESAERLARAQRDNDNAAAAVAQCRTALIAIGADPDEAYQEEF